MTNASGLGSARRGNWSVEYLVHFVEPKSRKCCWATWGVEAGLWNKTASDPIYTFLPALSLFCASANSLFFTPSVRSETAFSLQLHLVRAESPTRLIDGQRSRVSMPLGPHCGCAWQRWMSWYRWETMPQIKPELKVRACVEEPWCWSIQHSTETHRLARLRKDGWLRTCLFPWMWKWLGPYCIASSLFCI